MTLRMCRVALLLCQLYTACVLSAINDNPPTVTTKYGPIRGQMIRQARVFQSIPYAAPPVNELRFANPEPPMPWTDTMDCTQTVVGCPQSCHDLPLTCTECPAVKSEDCLFLNVWTPIMVAPDSKLAVLLFIHGGGFTTGYGGGLAYNGTAMVNLTGTVVVTINYRLGALGSLYDAELGLQGNYGYLDQVAAIEWTHENIAAFGGDPARIVIFGESAGAHSVALHWMNESSVVAGAILESTPAGFPLRTHDSWGTLPLTLSAQLQCDPQTLAPAQRLACLRAVKFQDVVHAQTTANQADPQTHYENIKNGMPWTPTVGHGSILEDQPVVAFQRGHFRTDAPFILGTNSGESYLFTAPVVSYDALKEHLDNAIGAQNTPRVFAFYNITEADRGENLMEQAGAIATDYQFRCPSRNLVESSVKFAVGAANIGYNYHMNYLASYVKHMWYFQPLCWTHVCHEEELPAVWDPNATSILVFPTPAEVLMSHQVQYYWTNLAKHGSPNSDAVNQEWNTYGNMQTQRTLMVNTVGAQGIVMEPGVDVAHCDFWDDIGYDWYNGINW